MHNYETKYLCIFKILSVYVLFEFVVQYISLKGDYKFS